MSQILENVKHLNNFPDTTEALFLKKGVIDKDTFDCYFRSKEALMNIVIAGMIEEDRKAALKAASEKEVPVLEKFFRVITAQRPKQGGYKEQLIEHLHKSENAEFHQKSLLASVENLSPILAEVVREGVEKQVFHTTYPRETMDFLLVASALIFDEELFGWNEEEMKNRAAAFVYIMEKCLGTSEGSFGFIYKMLTGIDHETGYNQKGR